MGPLAVRRPNLFIVGAHRCGTSAMFEFLGAHPEIYPSVTKEPHYFTPARNTRTLDEYLELFAGSTTEPWLLDATPEYLYTEEALRLIREFSPEARAIVMVRDPIEQMRSLHDMYVLFRPEPIDLAHDLAGPRAERLYWNRVRSGVNLSRLLAIFPPDNVHTVVYDDFRADNAGEYRRVLEFLGVDTSFTPQFRAVIPTKTVRSRTLQRSLWDGSGALRAIARATLPKRIRKKGFNWAARLNWRRSAQSQIDPDLAQELWRKLEPDVELLSRLLDRDLVSLWRR